VTTLALLLTLSATPTLAVTHAHAPTASPAASKAEHEVAFRIESKALLEHQVADAADDTTYFVRTDGTRALTETHGVRVVEAATAPAIVVHLSWVSYADSIYGVKIETVQPGEPPRLVERFQCECADSELTAAILARLPTALEQLAARDAAVGDPAGETHGRDSGTEPSTVGTDDRPRRPLGALGKAGIGVAAFGVGTLIGGGVVYSLGTRFDPPTGMLEERDGRNYRPPGVALMVTGGAALVTGAVLLIVDRTRSRNDASARLLPSPGGLVLTGRF
jgi:hypothetical protein